MSLDWSDALEQRVRALPGVRFAEARRNSKMYMVGPLRFFVPTGPIDHRTRQRIEAEFETFRRRVRKQDAHEFGTRPSDVDAMRPMGPEEPTRAEVAEVAAQIATEIMDGTLAARVAAAEEEAARVIETTDDDRPAVNPAPVPAEEGDHVSARNGTRKLTFGPCPVEGCDGVAAGRHIAMHKAKGELPKTWTAKAARRDAKAETKRRRSESASTESRDAHGADVRHYVEAIYKGLTDLSKNAIKELADYADTLKAENTQLRRENAQMREAMDRFEKAFAFVKQPSESVIAKLRR